MFLLQKTLSVDHEILDSPQQPETYRKLFLTNFLDKNFPLSLLAERKEPFSILPQFQQLLIRTDKFRLFKIP